MTNHLFPSVGRIRWAKTQASILACLFFTVIARSGLGSALGQQPPVTIEFSSPAYSVAEDAGTALITVHRTGDPSNGATADYSTSDGTGAAGKDYLAQQGTLIFAPDTSTQTIKIPILDNGSVDGPRTVNLTVSNSAIFPKPSTATLTITDNERPVLFDPSFDPGQGALGAYNDPCVQTLAVQPDGKVIVGGCFTNVGGVARGGIARLNVDGSLDGSFDPGSGISGVSGESGGSPAVFTLALQADGKIILGGSFLAVNGRVHPSLARLNRDGTLDETFNAKVGGLGHNGPDVRQVVVQVDGKILLAGFSSLNFGLARLNSDGSLDTSFRIDHTDQPVPQVLAIALQADGKILAGGKFYEGPLPYLIRLSADGSLDSTFKATPPASLIESLRISSMALQFDGKILACANFFQTDGNSGNEIFRFNSDGSLDPTFNDGSGRYNYLSQIQLLANGKVLAVGYHGGVRLNVDGSLDRTFELEGLSAVAIQADGLIVAGGSFTGGVGRIFPDLGQRGGAEFTTSIVSTSETMGAVEVNLQRLGDTSQEMTVDFATSDLTAYAGLDYVAQQGTVHFAPLQVTNTLSIPLINDSLVEADKSFRITLSNPSSGSALQRFRTATVVISSNDTGIQFALDTFTVDEAAGFAEVLVSRSGDGLAAAAVDFSTSDGTATAGADYLARSSTITFASGEMSKAIQIPILDDGAVEGNETIQLVLKNPRAGAMLGARTNATLLIRDNEIPTHSLGGTADFSFSTTNASVNEDAGLAVVTIQRSGDSSQSASVHYTTKDGTALANLNYLSTEGMLNFGPLEIQQTIVIPILADGQPSADASLSIRLSRPSAGTILNAGRNVMTLTVADGQRPGSVDSTFSPIIETTNVYSTGFHLAQQPDGKVIVAGGFQRVNGVARNGICRLNSDGSLDPSFDPRGGLIFQDEDPNVADPVYALALQTNGMILVRGFFNSVNGLNYTNFVRLNAEGLVDTSFVPDAAAQLLNPLAHGAALAVQPDGKILVSEGEGGDKPAKLARLTADGSADPTFFTLEVVGVDGGWGSTFKCVVVEDDGSALFEGNTDSSGRFPVGPQKGLTRLNADGSIDQSFHPIMDHLVRFDIGSRTLAVVQPDRKIITAGFFTDRKSVV